MHLRSVTKRDYQRMSKQSLYSFLHDEPVTKALLDTVHPIDSKAPTHVGSSLFSAWALCAVDGGVTIGYILLTSHHKELDIDDIWVTPGTTRQQIVSIINAVVHYYFESFSNLYIDVMRNDCAAEQSSDDVITDFLIEEADFFMDIWNEGCLRRYLGDEPLCWDEEGDDSLYLTPNLKLNVEGFLAHCSMLHNYTSSYSERSLRLIFDTISRTCQMQTPTSYLLYMQNSIPERIKTLLSYFTEYTCESLMQAYKHLLPPDASMESMHLYFDELLLRIQEEDTLTLYSLCGSHALYLVQTNHAQEEDDA